MILPSPDASPIWILDHDSTLLASSARAAIDDCTWAVSHANIGDTNPYLVPQTRLRQSWAPEAFNTLPPVLDLTPNPSINWSENPGLYLLSETPEYLDHRHLPPHLQYRHDPEPYRVPVPAESTPSFQAPFNQSPDPLFNQSPDLTYPTIDTIPLPCDDIHSHVTTLLPAFHADIANDSTPVYQTPSLSLPTTALEPRSTSAVPQWSPSQLVLGQSGTSYTTAQFTNNRVPEISSPAPKRSRTHVAKSAATTSRMCSAKRKREADIVHDDTNEDAQSRARDENEGRIRLRKKMRTADASATDELPFRIEDGKYVCIAEGCAQYRFTSITNFMRHYEWRCSSTAMVIKCKACARPFSRRDSYKRHLVKSGCKDTPDNMLMVPRAEVLPQLRKHRPRKQIGIYVSSDATSESSSSEHPSPL